MSYRIRLILTFSLVISLTFGLGCTALIATSFRSVLKEEKESIMNEYETIQNNIMMLLSFSEEGDYGNLKELLHQMKEQNIAHWQAFSLGTEETKIYENGDSRLLSFTIPLKEENTYAYTQKAERGQACLQVYSELSSGRKNLYLKASFDLSTAYELRRHQQSLFLVIYLAVMIFGISIAGILASVLTKRLKKLMDAVGEIADGNLSVRTGLRTGDEFQKLSMDFDRMTDKLQDTIEQLEGDVERKEAFMGAVAHELKTPMTSIIGYADMIRQCGLSEEEQMMAANYIYTEGKRLEQLSHKILDLLLMEKENFNMRKVEMSTFLKNVIQVLVPAAEKKGVHIFLKCEEMFLFLEPDLAKSLFYNLVDNGIKAAGKGGKVIVIGRKKQTGSEIQIVDDGYGMETEELEKITEAFYRIDKSRSRQQGGVGLGLTICKKIVDLHQGSMTFQSKVGTGSSVTVQLPNGEEYHEEQ